MLVLARTGVPMKVGLELEFGFVLLRPGGSKRVVTVGSGLQAAVVVAVAAAAAAIADPWVVVAGTDRAVAAVEESTSGEAVAVDAGPRAR